MKEMGLLCVSLKVGSNATSKKTVAVNMERHD
jgi:hypothetical protein